MAEPLPSMPDAPTGVARAPVWSGPPASDRSPSDIAGIRRAARAAAEALAAASGACRPGATTAEIDRAARDVLRARGACGLFRGYRQGRSPPFPADTCISVNDEVVHGIPGRRTLHAGDAVSIDVGLVLDDWCADAATTVLVGGPAAGIARAERVGSLIRTTREILARAVASIRPGVEWSSIAAGMERAAEEAGFGIVTEYVGHGIGRNLHESPKVPSYRTGFTDEDFIIQEGMVLAIEPMLTLGRGGGARGELDAEGYPAWRTPIRMLDDGWTVVTADGSVACHEEHMVLVTARGGELLTLIE